MSTDMFDECQWKAQMVADMMRYYEDGDMYDDNDVLVDFFAHLIKSRIINVLYRGAIRAQRNEFGVTGGLYLYCTGAVVLKYPE